MQYPIVLAMAMLIGLGQTSSTRTNAVAKQPFVVRNIGDNWVTKVKRAGGDSEPDVVPRGILHNNVGRQCVHDAVSGVCNIAGQCELAGPGAKDKHGKARKPMDPNCLLH
ncbi:hypothetical protein MCOR25_001804 [Pyricularia grisea]|uniref:Uncharacterized protein n=1 Tax=Pyricularia grisea TaxID=148305 RepID=A0A6P8B753_PYRGI|nr:hypothetical protein PgNI_05267 [Pyricularia grisea]KAI6380153.1 hypothetical protein MCOR25_001804 [Pyricularia grisea]TLD11156.1 hypothetical protein PgNI_05267 [Pyricularia grisea]